MLKLSDFPENIGITNQDIAVISIIAFFLAGVKQAYLPLLLTLFAIPIHRFGSKKRYFGCIFLVLIVALISFLIPQAINQSVMRNIPQPEKEYEKLQKNYLISHPDQIPTIIRNTLQEYPLFYLSGYFGTFWWLNTSISFPFLVLFCLFFVLIILIEASETGHIPIRLKTLSFLAVMVSLIGMFTKMYVSWTSLPWVIGIGAYIVAGIQGRYFIPLTLFGCLLLSNSWIRRINFFSTLCKYIYNFYLFYIFLYNFYLIIFLSFRFLI